MSNASTVSASTTEENLAESSVENITDQILAEASENFRSDDHFPQDVSRMSEEEEIIDIMDRDLPTTSGGESSLRRRTACVEKEEDRISIKLKYM